MDIRWDNPAMIRGNGKFTVQGVNVYRSYDSQFSGYVKLNSTPLGSMFYRDGTTNTTVTGETATYTAEGQSHPGGHYIIQADHYPIVKAGTQALPADSPSDVTVTIDGQNIKPLKVLGLTGEIYLDQRRYWDKVRRQVSTPVLPTDSSVTTISYQYNTNLIQSTAAQRIFYKVTTVATYGGETVETPLTAVEGISSDEIEKLDYIWKEAIRRNRWILEQGGEAVKVFIRKWLGDRCSCWSDTHKQARNDCLSCFGTGIVGGYEGPFDILIAPQDGERRVELTPSGLAVMHQYEVWTGPTPMLSQRDFIVRQNNDRYTIGAVNTPSHRGNLLQQSFAIGYISERDIRYQVNANSISLDFPQTRVRDWNQPGTEGTQYPMVTDNSEIGTDKSQDGTQERGRTPTYGRIMR
tara:strand:+ start:5925 stop:7148 length:1224 start_codon:yes stop_codon:yes gene_type:complete